MPKYIMHEDTFESLCCVEGFNNLNGKTYFDHICIIFNLDFNEKKKIYSCETIEEAKKILKEELKINYTHNYYL